MPGHGDLGAVGENIFRQVFELFNKTEDIIPAPAVEAGHVFPEFIENFFRLEGGQNGFDEYRCLDRATGDIQEILGPDKDIVPQAGFQVALQLGQVKIGAGALRMRLAALWKEVKGKVKETPETGRPSTSTCFPPGASRGASRSGRRSAH